MVAMSLFALSMSISPGPVNLITLTTGTNLGIKKTMPFVSGATVGFTLLLYLLGLSYVQLAGEYNQIINVLSLLGNGYVFYMGYKLLTSKGKVGITPSTQPSFIHGFLLQWLNPKAWGACIVGITAFNLSESHYQLTVFVAIYFMVCYLSITAWALFGVKINELIHTPQHLKTFNTLMGGCLVVIALYLGINMLLKAFDL